MERVPYTLCQGIPGIHGYSGHPGIVHRWHTPSVRVFVESMDTLDIKG